MSVAILRPIIIKSDTATGYSAVRSVVQGRPLRTTHAFILRVPPFYILKDLTWSDYRGIRRGNDC
eukprot:6046578-Pleurochrysis_carterae.AAC.1